MAKKTKILLTISLVSFALGATGLFWGIGMPLGAIFFGLFMIFKVLEKETALFDEENGRRLKRAENKKNTFAQSLEGIAEDTWKIAA